MYSVMYEYVFRIRIFLDTHQIYYIPRSNNEI